MKNSIVAKILVVSLILYILLLFSCFTAEIDTYICYTTDFGECYHAEYCQYLYNSANKTTIYQAEKSFRDCSKCNPIQEKYATTITVRDYKSPFVIVLAISIGGYFTIAKTKHKR